MVGNNAMSRRASMLQSPSYVNIGGGALPARSRRHTGPGGGTDLATPLADPCSNQPSGDGGGADERALEAVSEVLQDSIPLTTLRVSSSAVSLPSSGDIMSLRT